ncbi:MAG: hypothetical protein NTZ35_05815 [Ignavibacteriales bacterium]|nr:hypothetical protein [Ignavibacteriales bacterium]
MKQRGRRISKLLIDARNVTGTISAMERIDFSVIVAKAVFGEDGSRIMKVAIAGNEPLVDPARFAETVAVNRGAQAEVTLDLDEALKWLDM